jgi:hypothetical protein
MAKSLARISKQEIPSEDGQARLITDFGENRTVDFYGRSKTTMTIKQGRRSVSIDLTDEQLADLKWALSTHLNF